jgi:pimeloyl-ACP methyl ester carboxylesterase
MSQTRAVEVSGRPVLLLEAGQGAPLLYLHGLADVHGAVAGWLPFHEALAQSFRLLAPAHPGCATSAGSGEVDGVEDLVFHYLDLLDALGLERVDVLGACLGGWIAAELALRHSQRIRRLVLMGAPGLHVPGSPIEDVFMLSQRRDWGSTTTSAGCSSAIPTARWRCVCSRTALPPCPTSCCATSSSPWPRASDGHRPTCTTESSTGTCGGSPCPP